MGCKTCGSGWHTVEQVAHGVVGLAKVAAGIDRTSEELSQSRLDICKGCEHLKRSVVGLSESADVSLTDRCDVCGCFVRGKVLIESERCPNGKW